jgi:hypothetical protein
VTLLGGKVVYGDGNFKDLAPPFPPAMPDWSPVRTIGNQKRADAGQQRKVRLRGRLRMQQRLQCPWPRARVGVKRAQR